MQNHPRDKFIGFLRLKGFLFLVLFLCFCLGILFSSSVWGIVCLDEACVRCHVLLSKAVNVSLTHPNLLVGCITCHGPECLPGIHRDGIRQLDPAFYNFTGTAANAGCNVCHGAPPQALCPGGLVMDHCLDPSGCSPEIFNCVGCHPNFNGTSAHIYPKIPILPPFAPVASIANCLACHGRSLLIGRSGAHATHFITALMAPLTTGSFGVSIGCGVCHLDLTANLGADHLVCIPGTSNALLPGKVPVIFDPLLPQVGFGDFYQPGLIGGTGSCVVYCHSNGQTSPATPLSALLGYPGSRLPVPWNVPFPIDPIILNCGCCHAFPPVTHSGNKVDCSKCHPTPLLGAAPTSTYHINGIPDLWKFLAAAGPMVPLILPSEPSPLANNSLLTDPQTAFLTLSSGVNMELLHFSLDINNIFGFPAPGLTLFNPYTFLLNDILLNNLLLNNSGIALPSPLGIVSNFRNPSSTMSFINDIPRQGLAIPNNFFPPGLNYASAFQPGPQFRVFGLSGGGGITNFINPAGNSFNYPYPQGNIFPSGGGFNSIGFPNNLLNFQNNLWNLGKRNAPQSFTFSMPKFKAINFANNLSNLKNFNGFKGISKPFSPFTKLRPRLSYR